MEPEAIMPRAPTVRMVTPPRRPEPSASDTLVVPVMAHVIAPTVPEVETTGASGCPIVEATELVLPAIVDVGELVVVDRHP